MSCELLGTFVYFDSRNDSSVDEDLDKGDTISLFLPDRLVAEDSAANALTEPLSSNDQFTIGSSSLLRLRNPQGGKSLVACRSAFVHREQPFVVSEKRRCSVSKRL